VTDTGAEAGLGQVLCVSVTVYVPVDFTTIDCVVSPSLHRLPEGEEEVSVTLSPGQKDSPDAVIDGAAGIGFTATMTATDGGLVQPPEVCVTVNEPGAETVIL
jgi:hypothetical protein